MTLNYKASNIAKAEREYGLKLFEVMRGFASSSFGMMDIVFLLQAGGASVEETDDLIQNRGIDEVLILIMEGLGRAGFLPKGLKIQEIRQKMEKAQAEALKNIGAAKSD